MFLKHQKTRNNNQRERKQQDLPTFTINPVNPDSPIGKLFKLGQNNPPKLKKFSNPRPQQQPQPNLVASASERNPQRQHGPKRGSKIDRNHVIFSFCYVCVNPIKHKILLN